MQLTESLAWESEAWVLTLFTHSLTASHMFSLGFSFPK